MHVGTPEYAHGVQKFPDFLEMKVSDPQLPNSAYYRDAMHVKLDRQIGSRYYVTAKNAGRISTFLLKELSAFFNIYNKSNP